MVIFQMAKLHLNNFVKDIQAAAKWDPPSNKVSKHIT